MRDVQNEPDERGLPLDAVGVAGVRLPVVAFGRPTVAMADLQVSLAADRRGTHMSRLVELLHQHRESLDLEGLAVLLADTRERLDAETVHARFALPYFVSRTAPVSGATGLLDLDVVLEGRLGATGTQCTLEVTVPVQSLCPCSKAVSDYGAHNQRGRVYLRVSPVGEGVTIDALAAIAEAHGSAPILPIIKRADERHVTMQAYDNPVFVEDMARGVAAELVAHPGVGAFRVRVVNDESIHNHQAVAEIAQGES
ncbi:MAG: GTP cyclohydrolase I FolE2 [Deltaproteobacteria bacterium]|nr:GTP cyclohydrolase I FolE2 [Deltaproteobacteria bacterium]